MDVESNTEFQIVLSETTQDSIIQCHLKSHQISAVDMEIRWFKETDCVCFYKNRRLIKGKSYEDISLCIDDLEKGIVSLQLKDVRKSDDALNTHEDRTAETEQIKKEWTNEERIKMENSALLAVFCDLEKTDAPTELQTGMEFEENKNKKEAEQDYIQKHENGSMMEDSTRKPEEQENLYLLLLIHFSEKVKMFSILDKNTKECKEQFITTLRKQIGNLKEGKTKNESDFILVFCPVVSRAGTDIEAALKESKYSEDSKPTVLVVLHHTFDSEKTIPESSKYAKMTNLLKVDCLFNEDVGLLKCQRNSDSTDKAVNWIKEQGAKMGITISPCQHSSSGFSSASLFSRQKIKKEWTNEERIKMENSALLAVCSAQSKETNDHDKEFTDPPECRFENLKKVSRVDIIWVLCPFSQTEDDFDKALKLFSDKTETQLAVLVVIHLSSDQENIIQDSSKYVNRSTCPQSERLAGYTGHDLPDKTTERQIEASCFAVLSDSNVVWAVEQRKDPELQVVINWEEAGEKLAWEEVAAFRPMVKWLFQCISIFLPKVVFIVPVLPRLHRPTDQI
ncbi:hypothetical protein Q8A67_016006 [Cirrhinus molitorella]|uniref:Uncharacterized protein n=1 Tax=Cirrhinus molitorella TaxID=172907 RepID=A0AA88THW6_9TELE|nr:hypothetical protein Q8A67_016006 [Cirrhinus molitorella]